MLLRLEVIISVLVVLLLKSSTATVCKAKKKYACWCDVTAEQKTIDMSYYDNTHRLNTTVNDTYYTFNPCVPFVCTSNDNPSQVCMYNRTNGDQKTLGRLTDTIPWRINSFSPLNFTIQYKDGDVLSPSNIALYATVRVVYTEDVVSNFTFLGTTYHSDNLTMSYEFQLLTSQVFFTNDSNSTGPASMAWIAGAVAGSWLILVVVLSVTVISIICGTIRYDRKKRSKTADYQPIQQAPEIQHT